jgi:hypothetical protein
MAHSIIKGWSLRVLRIRKNSDSARGVGVWASAAEVLPATATQSRINSLTNRLRGLSEIGCATRAVGWYQILVIILSQKFLFLPRIRYLMIALFTAKRDAGARKLASALTRLYRRPYNSHNRAKPWTGGAKK